MLYLARDTLQSGCERPWRKLEPHVDVVRVSGRHWGECCMIADPWVREIADDMSRRLASTSTAED